IPLSSLVPQSFSPAAASGGLLCFLSDCSGPKTLLLVNPISKIAACLPPTPTPRLFPAAALSVGPSSITAVVAGDDLISPFAVKNLTSETFLADAATGFYSPWTGPPSPLPRLCNIDPSRMAFAANRFYCMSSSPFAVLVYDVAANAWSKLQPPMRRFLRSPSIVELDDAREGGGGDGGGKIALVAAVEKSRLSVPRSVRVWALQACGRAWAEADRMPADVHARFCAAEAGRGFECVANGGVIAFTIKAAAAAAAAEVLLFDSIRKEWQWAPPCPFVAPYGGSRALRGFAYEPRLATPAIGLLDSSLSLSFQGFSG
ncbi:protein UNUSUAL FLORAL ORGANS, partial [Ananas comosus]